MHRKRRPSLVEILIVISILLILMSIAGSKSRRAQHAQRTGSRPAPTSQTTQPAGDDQFFMRR